MNKRLFDDTEQELQYDNSRWKEHRGKRMEETNKYGMLTTWIAILFMLDGWIEYYYFSLEFATWFTQKSAISMVVKGKSLKNIF
ncbi:hypothetical protein [Terrilactibacillus laevilacticus]|uniref:TMhelix containing protein n=2 Tax=Terrilactibacillus laevilacticus TaxID=1380157 RepID=A0ABW5PNN0_9BACI